MSFMLSKISDVTRSPGDPKVLETGPSSIKPVDRFGRALGWLSLGLGLTEVLAAPRLTKALGVEGKKNFVRAMGARELVHGVLCLSVNNDFGAWTSCRWRCARPRGARRGVSRRQSEERERRPGDGGDHRLHHRRSSRRAEHPQPAQPFWRNASRLFRPYRLPKRNRLFAWQGVRTSAAAFGQRPRPQQPPTTGETSPASADLILEVSA